MAAVPDEPTDPMPQDAEPPNEPGVFVDSLSLTGFRNYAHVQLHVDRGPVVLIGDNGAGKTNLLEAVSLLAPGQGLRRAPSVDFAAASGDGTWAVSAQVNSRLGSVRIGTGITAAELARGGERRANRIVRIDGETRRSSTVLADYVDAVWLTPAMDGLFVGPAAERRRFLDRLVLCFDPAFKTLPGQFEKAMQNRNKLLALGTTDPSQFAAFERVMAEAGTAIAAARNDTLAALTTIVFERRERDLASPFPWAEIKTTGTLELALADNSAADVEDDYFARLAQGRARDAAAGRTLEGPHRSDIAVAHGPKEISAHLCSTGEQKALLLGLVLAQTELIARRHEGAAPLLLLDEITAHFDRDRRAALFAEIVRLGAQAWMTGTDLSAFEAIAPLATVVQVAEARLTVSDDMAV
ncbi:MAG: DNA replication/repair protein RecF [Pseudomonadota bacterium]